MSPRIFFRESSLRRGVREFMAYYHGERAHQGVGNPVLTPHGRRPPKQATEIIAAERLGGLLRSYRATA